MRIATWNINSIRARHDRLLAWLAQHGPDVVCLQEIKTEDEKFPADAYRAQGYESVTFGQRTYNGVAILSKRPLSDVTRGLGGEQADPQARLLGGTVDGVRIFSVYAPNGQTVGSDKWIYKLDWLGRLRRYLDATHSRGEPVALCGDFNVAPEERDVHDPALWEREVLFHPDARHALAEVCSFGLRDAYRLHHADPGKYTWWDYRQLSFPKNRGLRIDHVLLSDPLAERCRAAEIDREARKGKQPSDHAPVVVTLDA